MAPDESNAANHQKETTCWSRRLLVWNKGYYSSVVLAIERSVVERVREAQVVLVYRPKYSVDLSLKERFESN